VLLVPSGAFSGPELTTVPSAQLESAAFHPDSITSSSSPGLIVDTVPPISTLSLPPAV
jgi:hypothetical protein